MVPERFGGGMPMQRENTKAEGLLRLLAQGLPAHAEHKTTTELGDRSQYIGMPDIGEGLECMRAAVALRCKKIFSFPRRFAP